MDFLLFGFALAALTIILSRKDGPRGLLLRLREWIGTPLACSVCCAFWFWLPGSVIMLWGNVTLQRVIECGGALGVAYAVLALAGALDLDR